MNTLTWSRSLGIYLLKFLHLQLFLTLVSLPILSAWGLPVSLMTFVGNLIFAPILTIYLIISALIFMTQLCRIPNIWLIYCLELLTTCWEWITGLGYANWLIGIPTQPLLISLCLLVVVLVIMHSRRAKSLLWSTGALLLLFILIILLCKTVGSTKKNFLVPHGSQSIQIFTKNKGIIDILLPKRFALQTRSIDSWIDYTLLPEITKKIGSWHGCTIIAHKKTGSIDRLVTALQERYYLVELKLQERG